MSQQVRSDRALTSRQLVLQGFSPSSEDKRVGTAMDKRNQWIAKMLQESTGLEASRLTFEASHATTHDALSRLSIITLKDQSIASLAARVMTARKFSYERVPITWKRQQTAYDRIVSAPAKSCMDIISRSEPKYQSCLRPNWREGYVAQVADRAEPDILFRWLVNPERARMRLYITKKLIHIVEGEIDAELRKLQFGPIGPDKGKGGKGGGKTKKGKKGGAPINPQAFRQEPSMVRDQLGNLTFSRFPFNISIRELTKETATSQEEKKKRETNTQDMDVDSAGQASKRQAEKSGAEQDAKRRSPTPHRGAHGWVDHSSPYPPLPAHHQAHHQAPATEWASDPWAAAACTARSSSSYAGASGGPGAPASSVAAPPPEAHGGDLRPGSRISA